MLPDHHTRLTNTLIATLPHDHITRVFALTTRGLETVSAREMARIPGVTITQASYRRIAALCAGSLTPLLSLRTVDDVFLDVASWSEIGRARSTLERLQTLSTQLDLCPALQQLAERLIRHIRGRLLEQASSRSG